MDNTVVKVIVIIFAIIGLITVLGFIAMWLMHGSMMGGMMDDNCMQMMGNGTANTPVQ